MPTYRAYRLDDRRHIRSAEWVEAPSDTAAVERASELCDETTPKVEIWHAARLVDEIDCADAED
jgi:hypothetical protein